MHDRSVQRSGTPGLRTLLYNPVITDVLLIGLMLLTLALAVTFLCHCFVVVPYVPTPWPIVSTMVKMADLRGDETVYDLGAGDARLLSIALQRHPRITAKGFEIIPTVWALGKLRLWVRKQKAVYRCRDFFGQNLADADVIFLYLIPSAMKSLEQKLDHELSPGTRVISHSFRFPGKTPVRQQVVGQRRPKTIYEYRW